MCVYSAVVDRWKPYVAPVDPYDQWKPVPPPASWPPVDAQTADLMRKALEILDRIDKKLGMQECTNNAAEKAAFVAKLDTLCTT